MRRLLALLVLLATPALSDPVTGSVGYLARVMLPPESVVTVRLIDTARQDVAAVAYAETRRLTLGGPPFAFALEVDPRLLGERRRVLQLEATVEVAGRVRMRTTQAYVLTPESFSQPVELTVETIGVRDDGEAPALTCKADNGEWAFALAEGAATLTTPTPTVTAYAGTVTRPADDLVVWEGGPPIGYRLTAVFHAETCGGEKPWSLVLAGGGTVRTGCCEEVP